VTRFAEEVWAKSQLMARSYWERGALARTPCFKFAFNELCERSRSIFGQSRGRIAGKLRIPHIHGDFGSLSPFVYNSARSRISMKPVVVVLRKNISGRELIRSVGI
jgi:hypothetical protein